MVVSSLGGDLSYHLEKNGKFTVERVRLYIVELSLALEYLRASKIIHRDVKPANMLLDSQGHVHLTDFNVATTVRSNVSVTSTTGTKPYMG
jgi:serine/threonine kinase 32